MGKQHFYLCTCTDPDSLQMLHTTHFWRVKPVKPTQHFPYILIFITPPMFRTAPWSDKQESHLIASINRIKKSWKRKHYFKVLVFCLQGSLGIKHITPSRQQMAMWSLNCQDHNRYSHGERSGKLGILMAAYNKTLTTKKWPAAKISEVTTQLWPRPILL